MIRIQNLSFTYPGSTIKQLDDISLLIEKGEFIAIIGENGCGKSTLCKALNGLIPHYFSGDYVGEVTIGNVNVAQTKINVLAQKVGYVYQDFENQIIRPTVLDDASFAAMNFACPDYKDIGRAALEKVGLANKQNDYVWQLSGGQKHLLALASASALDPEILVLDEPIAQLDPLHAKAIYDLLKQMNADEAKTIIVIEHHTEFIAKYCTHVVMMKAGKVLWKLPVKEALNHIEELQQVNIYPPQVTLAASVHKYKKGISKHSNALLPITLEEGLIYFSDIQEKSKSEKPRSHHGLKEKMESTVAIKNLSLSYDNVKGPKTQVFNDLNLTFYKGENIGIIGNNGAGKTTLFKLLTGIVKASGGQIHIKGEETTRLSPEKIASKISLVYQNPEQMFISDSIEGDIMFAMKARKVKNYELKTKALLERFNLTDIKHRDGRLLSGGQMRRASLAIGIALNPTILLLDEPTANLDIATRKGILKMLKEMNDVVDTAVIASHDMQLITEWADRIIVINNGEIIGNGTREEIFGNEIMMKMAGIEAPLIHQLALKLNEKAQCFTTDEFCDYFKLGEEQWA